MNTVTRSMMRGTGHLRHGKICNIYSIMGKIGHDMEYYEKVSNRSKVKRCTKQSRKKFLSFYLVAFAEKRYECG